MSSPPASLTADYKPVKSAFQRFLVNRIFQLLFPKICFEIDFQDGDIRKIGSGFSTIKVAPPSFLEICKILRNPNFFLPQAFVDGKWFVSAGDLAEFVVLMSRRAGHKSNNTGIGMGLLNFARHFYKHYLHIESTRATRRHYNDDPKIYEIVLGPSMIYSCAFFATESDTLEAAQANKLETTLTRLLADQPVEAILDIGCGWGGFCLFAAQRTTASVDGISIASSQIDYARQQVSQLDGAIQERVHFFCEDYINFLPEQTKFYDRVVSIGMLEHVGRTQYKKYFSEIERLLKDDGFALVHSITRSDNGITNDWIDRYIFPGGYIPRISEVIRGIEDAGLRMENSFRHTGLNYKKTLQEWLNNLITHEADCLALFQQRLASASPRSQTVEEDARRAYRIWYFYLASIQSIFDRQGGSYDVTQFLLRKI